MYFPVLNLHLRKVPLALCSSVLLPRSGPNIFLNILLSKNLSFLSVVVNHCPVSHPYISIGLTTVYVR